jgi:hypothetical protein
MRFALVNARTPRLKPVCLECCEPIGAGYLRDFGTRLPYCDYICYASHCGKSPNRTPRRSCEGIGRIGSPPSRLPAAALS